MELFFLGFFSPVWVGHFKVSVIFGPNGVFATRALGHDTKGERESFPWLHTVVYHSLQGNEREDGGI